MGGFARLGTMRHQKKVPVFFFGAGRKTTSMQTDSLYLSGANGCGRLVISPKNHCGDVAGAVVDSFQDALIDRWWRIILFLKRYRLHILYYFIMYTMYIYNVKKTYIYIYIFVIIFVEVEVCRSIIHTCFWVEVTASSLQNFQGWLSTRCRLPLHVACSFFGSVEAGYFLWKRKDNPTINGINSNSLFSH